MRSGVLYVVGSFKSGGTETQLLEILRRLDRRRFEPHVICIAREGGLLAEVEKLGVEIRETGFTRLLSPLSWGRLRSHAAWARSRGIRIIQGFHFHGNLYGALLKRGCPGSSLVACEQAIYGPRAPRHRWARAFYYRYTDVVLANCEAVRRAAAARDQLDPARIAVIYGGVDIARYRPLQGPRAPGGSVIGVVGRLHPDKGQMILVEAAPAILKEIPTARFVLVGDGPQRGEIEARVAALGLTRSVELLGDRRDVPELLAAMDLLVLPSASEGFANAALEGSSSGLPVVASDAGGNPEIVEDGVTGRIFKVGDGSRLASCILDLLRDPQVARRAGEAGRRRVERMFPLEEMVHGHERLYEDLLARADRAASSIREAS
jgi:glycosyltransferase involved in cell wall biosynthesis